MRTLNCKNKVSTLLIATVLSFLSSSCDFKNNTAIESINTYKLEVIEPVENSFVEGTSLYKITCLPGLKVYISGDIENSPIEKDCTNPEMELELNLTSTEGEKNILFEQILEGNRSSISLNIVKDSTAPILTIDAPVPNLVLQGKAVTLSGSCEQSLPLKFAGDVSPIIETECEAGTYSQPVNFTSDGVKTVNIIHTDLAMNETVESVSFTLDDTPPGLSIAAPLESTRAQSSITLSGACEDGLALNFSGAGILSAFNTTCSAGSYHQDIFLSSGEGSKVISVSQTDSVGNEALLTRTFVRDNTAPVITQTQQISPYHSSANTATFGGNCETGLAVTVKLAGVTENTTSCASGTWSYTTASQSTDNSRLYSFSQTDEALNVGTVGVTWVRDTQDPSLSIISNSNYTSAGDTASFSGSCEAGLSTVSVTGAQTTTINCNAGAWNFTSSAFSVDGTYNFTFTIEDLAGNTATQTGSWTRDTSGPIFTVSTLSILNTSDTATFSGTCEDGLDIDVSGADNATATCTTGSWTYTTSAKTTDGTYNYTFGQTNLIPATTSQAASWTRDTTAPQFQAGEMDINEGASTATSRNVFIDFSVTDAHSNVKYICVKTTVAAPQADSSCWDLVSHLGKTPALNLNFLDVPYTLGLADITYTLYLWAKDDAGNISTLTNSGTGTISTDKAQITLALGEPPQLSQVSAANSDSASNPPLASELTVTTGQDVFIKWTATDDQALPAQSVDLYFTEDDKVFTKINSTPLANAAGSGCTLSVGGTGCYKWTSPLSTIFKMRVVVKDSSGFSAQASTLPINSGSVQIVAGNTDDGLNGSAKTAMFYSATMGNANFADRNSFVMTNNGDIYFRDTVRGILKIDNATGIVSLFLPTTGVPGGDGGVVSAATLGYPIFINLDFNNRLLIYDSDRIRRVDLNQSPPTISTIIGGGSHKGDGVTTPTDLQFDIPVAFQNGLFRDERMMRIFVVAPNGDIYFRSDLSRVDTLGLTEPYKLRYWVYRANVNPPVIESFYLGGVGSARFPSLDISSCLVGHLSLGFNKSTSELESLLGTHTDSSRISGGTTCFHALPAGGSGTPINFNPSTYLADPAKDIPDISGNIQNNWLEMRSTGRDGKIYAVNRRNGVISRYNKDTNQWDHLVGTGTAGYCDDGTLALSCAILPYDVFVTANSTLYFIDRGLIRMVTDAGTVATVAGQNGWFGDGGPALEARIAMASNHDFYYNSGHTKVAFYDILSGRIREFTIGGNIATIAGNGASDIPADNALAVSSPLLTIGNNDWSKISIDKSNGDVYAQITSSTSGVIAKIDRSDGLWKRVWGNGATAFHSNDDSLGTNALIRFGLHSTLMPYGISNSALLLGLVDQVGTVVKHRMFKTLNLSTRIQSHLAGIIEDPATSPLCADGSAAATCSISSHEKENMAGAKWDATNSRWLIPDRKKGEVIILVPGGNKDTLATGMEINYRSMAYDETNNIVFYCATNGRLYKLPVGGSPLQLDWPMNNMSCTGYDLSYDAVNTRLIFNFIQNGLYGLAVYNTP